MVHGRVSRDASPTHPLYNPRVVCHSNFNVFQQAVLSSARITRELSFILLTASSSLSKAVETSPVYKINCGSGKRILSFSQLIELIHES